MICTSSAPRRHRLPKPRPPDRRHSARGFHGNTGWPCGRTCPSKTFPANPFVLLPQNNSAHRIAVEHCRRSGFEPITVIRCDDPCQVRYYVSQGLGVTFSPAISWKNLWDTNRVALLPINAAGLSRTSLICWRSGEHLSPAASVFRDFAAAYFAALPAEAPPVSSGRDLPSFERRAQ